MRRVVLTAVLMTAATSTLVGPASANHSWNNYHWARTANPFTLQVGDSVSAAWKPYLDTALSDWSQSTVMDLTKVASSTTGRQCRSRLGRIEVCSAAYGSNGWLGLASISLSGGHITQGTAKMNDTYFSTPTYNNPNERLHVMCQEVGHDFGLGHTSEDGSTQNTCMDYFSNTGANAGSTVSTHPNQHDYDQLAAIYAHLDSTTTIGQATATSPSMADRDDTDAYRAERRDTKRESVITERFADGSARVTHVTWAR